MAAGVFSDEETEAQRVYVASPSSHTVGLFTLPKDTTLIHGVSFVRHRRFISCGSFLLYGLQVLKCIKKNSAFQVFH